MQLPFVICWMKFGKVIHLLFMLQNISIYNKNIQKTQKKKTLHVKRYIQATMTLAETVTVML